MSKFKNLCNKLIPLILLPPHFIIQTFYTSNNNFYNSIHTNDLITYKILISLKNVSCIYFLFYIV